MKNNNIFYICLLASLATLASCGQGQKLSKSNDKDNNPNSMDGRLSRLKQHEYDQAYFDGQREKMAGNYQNALRDFEQATKVDNDGASAWYEIANADVQLNKIEDAEKASEKAESIDKGENKWYLLQLSDIYRFEKKWDKAEDIYQKLIVIEPGNLEYYFRLAAIYEAAGKTAEAIKVYDRIDKTFGESDDVSLQKEKLYIGEGKYDKAIEVLNKLIEKNPNETSYYQLLAETWMKAGNEAKALEVYNDLLKKNPNDGETQLALAEFYYQKGDHASAFDMLKKAFSNPALSIDHKVSILYNDYMMQPNQDEEDKTETYALAKIMVAAHPAEAKAHAIYGDIFYLDKNYDSARVQYRKSLETKKDIFAVWQQLLVCEGQLKDYKALADESDKALELFPSQPFVYFMDGVSNLQLKNYKKAADVLESGLNQVTDNKALELEFYNNLAEAYYRLNDYAKSDMYFEKVLEKDPDNALALNNYAYYLSVRNEKIDKAEAMSKKSLEKEPTNGSYLDTYGYILYKEGKYAEVSVRNEKIDKAEAMSKKSLEKEPTNGSYLDTYGYILYKEGKYAEAEKYISQALETDKLSADVNEHYGDVEYKLGHIEKAVEYWKYAKQYGADSPGLDKKIANQKIVE